MQLQTTTRPSEFPAYTLRYLRRLANLTARYCDRVDAETDFNTREKNYKYALRCIFRIQKALWDNAGEIDNREERERLSEISDALLGAWEFLADRAPGFDCKSLGTLVYLAVENVENSEIYKTPFYYTLSEIKQRNR